MTRRTIGLLVIFVCSWRRSRPTRSRWEGLRIASSYLPPAVNASFVEAFCTWLRELGYVEGQNLAVEFPMVPRAGRGAPARAAELVRLPVDLIFAGA